MDKYAKAFVKSSLIYLGIGTILRSVDGLLAGYSIYHDTGSRSHPSSGIYGHDDLWRGISYPSAIHGETGLQPSPG